VRPFAITVLLLTSAAFCTGCHFSWPRVANVPVQQGNVITQEMVDKLKPGMTRRQIAFVMGEPVLRNPFNPDRWDYVYSVQVGSVVYQQLRMSLFFENDTLAKFTGDMAPTTAAQNKEADTVADPLQEGPREDQITPPAG
jgi:outer membrane protein assembly factor BamE